MSIKDLSAIGKTIDLVNDLLNAGRDDKKNIVESLKAAAHSLTAERTAALLIQKKVNEADALEILSAKALKEEESKLLLTTTANTTAAKANTASTFSLSSAYKGLAASIGISTTALSVLTGALAVVAVAFVGYQVYAQRQEELADNTRDAAEAFAETANTIDDYAKKYKALHMEMTKANTTEERQAEIKKELLGIQTELNDKYGDEYGKINLVTDAYRDQTSAIQALNKAAAEDYLTENHKGIEQAKTEMFKERNYFLGSTGNINEQYGQDILDIVSQYEDKGIDLSEFTDQQGNKLGYTINFKGNAEDADEVIHDLATKMRELGKTYEDHNFIESLLDNSSNALEENQTVLDTFRNSYTEAIQAEIQADPSSTLALGYAKATSAVNAYNNALTSGDDSKIDKTYNDLEKVKSSIDLTSDDWREYALVFNDVFDKADTRLLDFKNNLKNNPNEIAGLKDVNGTDLRAVFDSKDVSGDNAKYEEIISLAEKYELSVDDVISVLSNMGIIIDKVGEKAESAFSPKSLKDTIAFLDTMSDKFSSIDKLYKEFKDEDTGKLTVNKFSNEGMNSLIESFKDVEGINIDDFISTLSSSASTAEDVQEAFNQLSSQYIYASGCLDGLTDATAEQIIKELEAQGVVGASAVVMDHLSASKEFARLKSIDLANATTDEIIAFINESTQADETNSALARYALQKEISNGITLQTDGDIQNMAALVTAAGGAIEALNAYNRARHGIITALSSSPMFSKSPSEFSYKDSAGGIQLAQAQWVSQNAEKLQAQKNEADLLFAQADRDIKAAATKTTQTQAANSSDDGTGAKESEKEFNWIERMDKYLQDEHEKAQEIIDDETRSYYEQISAIHNLIDADKQRLVFAKDAAQKYTDEWNRAKESLSADKISKIMNGDISVESFKGQEADDVQNAIDAYDKKLEYEELLADTNEEINNHLREEIQLRENIISAQQDELSGEMDILKARMDLAETTGKVLTEGMYKRQISLSKEMSNSYEDQIDNLYEQLDLVENESAEYYSLIAKINDCEAAMINCRQQQAEWNEAIKRLPIDRMQKYINQLQNIKQDLQNFLDEQSALGINPTADQLRENIDLSEEQIKKLIEQQSKLKDLLDNYQYGSEKFNEVSDEIQDIDNEVSQLIQDMREFNNQILQIPVDKLNGVNDTLSRYSDTLSGVLSDYDSVLSAVNGALSEQIDKTNELKEATEDAYEEKIKPLQDELELLQKTNKERGIQLALEQAQYNLDRANSQKTNQVIRDGELTYESNADDLRAANQELADAQYNKIIHDLETQISNLEEERDVLLEGYDDEIERLTDIQDKWSKIVEQIKLASDMLKADKVLGEGWKDKITSGNDSDIYEMFKGMYESTQGQKDSIDEQIASNERVAEMMQLIADQYKNGSITYEQAMAGIGDLSSSLKDGYSSLEQLNALLSLDGIGDLADLSGAVQKDVSESVDLMSKYMGIVKDNSSAISEYTKTWDDMKVNIADQIEALRKAAEALEEMSKKQSSHSGGGSSSSGGGSSSNGGYVTGGPGYINDVLGGNKDAQDSWNSGNTGGASDNLQDAVNDKLQNRHNGIDDGLIGNYGGNKERLLQLVSTKELKTDEVYLKALNGEAVFTEEQQKMLLENFHNVSMAPKIFTPDYSKMTTKTPTIVNVSFGNIELPNVQDNDGFAKAIKMQFEPAIRQEMSKY